MDLNEIPCDQIAVKVTNFDGKLGVGSQNLGLGSMNHRVTRQKIRETEEKCLAIDLEIQKKSMDLEGVKSRIRVLEGEKMAIEGDIKSLREKRANFDGKRVNKESRVGESRSMDEGRMDGDEESKVDQLMIENKVLECEDSSALKEVEIWKQKCKELESLVLQLEGKLGFRGGDGITIEMKGVTENDGTPCIGSPQNQYVLNEDTQTARQVQNENICDGKIAPSTPGVAKSSSCALINVVDSDDEENLPAKPGVDSKGTPYKTSAAGSDERPGIFEEDVSDCSGELPMLGATKGKRGSKVVTSDDELEVEKGLPKKRKYKIYNSDNDVEDDDGMRSLKEPLNSVDSENESNDDNIPISQLKMTHNEILTEPAGPCIRTRRSRRLAESQQGKKKGRLQKTEKSRGNLALDYVVDDKKEEDYSDSDVDSMDNFIVDDDNEDVEDDVSEEDDTNDSNVSEDPSDDNLDFKEIISRLERRKNPNAKWQLHGDLLSAVGKDPEICMKGVCALYRQQTSAEKSCKESLVQNGRGFSKFDASRGTRLGEFLTGGDPNGDMIKSKEELQMYDPNGIEACRRLATHYSKQLFEIYENGEDPFFP